MSVTELRTGASRPNPCRTLSDPSCAVDWPATAFGAVEQWSPSLKTAAALAFAAQNPMLVFWGTDFLCIMNEPARGLRGAEPAIAAATQAWPELWACLQDDLRSVLSGGPAVSHAEWALPGDGIAARRFGLTLSPVLDPAASSGVGGVLATLIERAPSPATVGQAKKMEALGHMTGGVAHDFNNLLGALVGSFELIRRKHDDKARVLMLAEAGLVVTERAAKLTSQLLTFSRTHQLELSRVDVAAVVDGMREMLRRTLGPLTSVEFDVRCRGRFVLSDPVQLEMALLNFAINARDAMQEGGRLTVAAILRHIEHDPALPDGDYVELRVEDNGTGMSPEVAARAFDPFFTTKPVGKGTGLGLSQAHGTANQAGGNVRIESEPGQGTTIRMLLACIDPPPVNAREAASRPLPVADATILLVDDDHDLRAVLAATIEDLGYRVIQAVDGAEALVLLQRREPDLLIADFAMPGITGTELARSVRLSHSRLPIILASGYAGSLELDLPADPLLRVLPKPFRVGELQAEIERALAASAGTISAAE